MRPRLWHFVLLAAFCVLVIVVWLIGLHAIGSYLWNLLNGLSHV